jgi:polyferredoxin
MIGVIISIIISIIFYAMLRKIKYLRVPIQFILLLALNFTVIGSLWVSPVMPILRFPKLFNLPWLGEGVPLCTAGTIERTLTLFWPFMITIAILAILFLVCLIVGRALCSWACPIGLGQDLILRFLKRIKVNMYEPPMKIHKKMSVIKFAILFIVIAISISIGFALLVNQPMGELYRDIYDPMAQCSPACLGCPAPVTRYIYVDVGTLNPHFENPSNVFQFSVFLIFITGIFIIPRFWCRYLCPMGALASLFNKVSFLHLHKDQDKCTYCNYCVDVCPTRVDGFMTEAEQTRIADTGCTFCGDCIEACPEKALTFNLGKKVIFRGGGEWWERQKKKEDN